MEPLLCVLTWPATKNGRCRMKLLIMYGKIAETLAPYLTKGKCIGVDGELRQRRWETSGKPRSAVEIIADEIQLLTFSKAKNKKTQSPENCDDSLADLEGIL